MKQIIAPVFLLALFLAPSASALTPNDPLFSEQWYLDRISAEEAWEYSVGNESITVAVLDSGVDYVHEDLRDNIWVNQNEIPDNGLDDDGNGYIDDVNGYDFVWDEASPFPVIGGDALDSAVSHGTIVAGVIGAVGNNAEGVTGVAWDASIMPLRVLSELGTGIPEQAAEAIYYAVDNGADIINMSFAGYFTSPAFADAIEYAYQNDVVMVAAVGNEGIDISNVPVYPACYAGDDGSDWVIGVGSSNADDQRAEFSNYGSNCVDISAPGTDIFNVNYYDPTNGYVDEYLGGWNGTSVSAPIVSGAIAVLLSEYPTMTPADVMTLIKLSVDPMSGPQRLHMGAGRLNMLRAMEIAEQMGLSNIPDRFIETRFIRGETTNTVYAVTEEGRNVVINELAYFTYRDSFSDVEIVSDEELSSYRLRGVVLPQAGRVLVKIQSDPRVYWLDDNPKNPYQPVLRSIETEEIAIGIFGTDWADYVVDIEPIYFNKFAMGLPISAVQTLDTSQLMKRESLAIKF